MTHNTGLKLGNGSLVKTGNITIQAISGDVVSDASLATVSSDKSNNKIVSANGSAKKKSNLSQVDKDFVSPKVVLPYFDNVPGFASNKSVSNNQKNDVSKYSISSNSIAELQGLSQQRPEIVSLTDFHPIYDDLSSKYFNNIGEFLELQIAARKIRLANIKKLFLKLEISSSTSKLISDIKKSYLEQINLAKEELDFFVSLYETLKSGKNALNIKSISSINDNISLKLRSFRDFLVNEFLFSEKGYDSFSNTKVLGQFLLDSQFLLAQYSPSLFDVVDSLRLDNKSAIGYVDPIDLSENKFNFKISDYKSKTNINPINMGNTTVFSSFIGKLPNDPDDRIKLLITILSKEMRVSQALGNQSTTNVLKNTFSSPLSTQDNPFDDIFGKPGKTITDQFVGNNSLFSLLRVEDNDNILPYEVSFIRDNKQKTYIPGSKYFIENIIDSNNLYDLSRIKKYREKVEKLSNSSVSLLKDIMNVEDSNKSLWGIDLFNLMISDFINILDIVIKARSKLNDSSFTTEEYILFGVALLAISNSDVKLKSQLFQLVLLLGFKGTTAGEFINVTKPEEFFENLRKAEIKTYGDLSELQLSNKGGNINTVLNISTDDDIPDSPDDSGELQSDDIIDYLSLSTAIGLMIDKIVDRLFFIVSNGISEFSTSGLIVPFNKDEFKQFLSENTMIFQMIVNFIVSLDKKINSNDGYILDDGSAKSRFNLLTPSTRAALAFEIYSSFCKKYMDVGFQSGGSGGLSFTTNIFTLDETIEAFKSVSNVNSNNIGTLVQTNKPAGQQGFTFNVPTPNNYLYLEAITSLKEKLIKEDELILDVINRIEATFNKVAQSFENIEKFFDLKGQNSEKLKEIANSIDASEKLSLTSEAQLRLSMKELDDFESLYNPELTGNSNGVSPTQNIVYYTVSKTSEKKQYKNYYVNTDLISPQSIIFDDGDVPLEIRDLLFNVLSREKFNIQKGKNIKIVSVGLPAGFEENINSLIKLEEKFPDFALNKEKDIIKINVYRRDIEFEDIVFKPQTFLFELSRFVSRSSVSSNLDVLTSVGFDALKDSEIFMKDYSKYVKGELQSQESILNSDRYDFLTTTEKEQLIENHIISYLLEIYVRLLTGINLSEGSFFVNSSIMNNFIDDDSQNKFVQLLETYISQYVKTPITLDILKKSSPQIAELLKKITTLGTQQSFIDKINNIDLPGVSKNTLVSLTEDIITFLKAFSAKSLFTGGSSHRTRILSPKLFERIYHIPIDPDDFEIDVIKTSSNISGKQLLEKMVSLKKVIIKKFPNQPDKLFISEKTSDDIDFEEFFVNVETVGETTI